MKFYRYEYIRSVKNCNGYNYYGDIVCIEFTLVRETPKGYWIKEDSCWHDATEKWISKISKKRYAYPVEKEALDYFIRRKKSRLAYLNADTENVKSAITTAKNIFKNSYGEWEE